MLPSINFLIKKERVPLSEWKGISICWVIKKNKLIFGSFFLYYHGLCLWDCREWEVEETPPRLWVDLAARLELKCLTRYSLNEYLWQMKIYPLSRSRHRKWRQLSLAKEVLQSHSQVGSDRTIRHCHDIIGGGGRWNDWEERKRERVSEIVWQPGSTG